MMKFYETPALEIDAGFEKQQPEKRLSLTQRCSGSLARRWVLRRSPNALHDTAAVVCP